MKIHPPVSSLSVGSGFETTAVTTAWVRAYNGGCKLKMQTGGKKTTSDTLKITRQCEHKHLQGRCVLGTRLKKIKINGTMLEKGGNNVHKYTPRIKTLKISC